VHSTLLFYETPHRIKESLRDIAEVLGNRRAVLARELTKLHEQFLRGSIEELEAIVSSNNLRGEITLVIEGAGKDNREEVQFGSIAEQIEQLISAQSVTRTDALKAAAKSRGITRKSAYELLLAERRGRGDEDDD
jgi:16S rRNA (cytidine1402-2'-O)-methyltransferase